MLNRIILSGRLTRDPELRRTQSGIPVASFSLAVNRDFKDKATGETPVDFIDIVAWRHTGGVRRQLFRQGLHGRGGRAAPDPGLDGPEGGGAVPPRSWPATSTSGASAKKKSAPAPAATPCDPPASEFDADADGELPF